MVCAGGHWEKRSAMVLVLAVRRNQSPIIAARVSDVLRDAIDEFAMVGFMKSDLCQLLVVVVWRHLVCAGDRLHRRGGCG